MDMMGRTQGQMTVMHLVKLLNEGRRLPRPDGCPESVRSPFFKIQTQNKEKLLFEQPFHVFLVGRFMR